MLSGDRSQNRRGGQTGQTEEVVFYCFGEGPEEGPALQAGLAFPEPGPPVGGVPDMEPPPSHLSRSDVRLPYGGRLLAFKRFKKLQPSF